MNAMRSIIVTLGSHHHSAKGLKRQINNLVDSHCLDAFSHLDPLKFSCTCHHLSQVFAEQVTTGGVLASVPGTKLEVNVHTEIPSLSVFFKIV